MNKVFKKVILTSLFLALVCIGMAGCGSLEPTTKDQIAASTGAGGTVAKSGQPSTGADDLRVGDKITLVFSDTLTAMPPHEQQIREDGSITAPYVGEVKAAGKKKGDLERELTGLYVPKYFKRLTVTIKTEERVFYVGGEVRRPDRYIYSGELTVLKAVKAAMDFTDFANRTKVQIIRADKRTELVNCKKALQDPRLDLPIFPGDQIIVPRRLY